MVHVDFLVLPANSPLLTFPVNVSLALQSRRCSLIVCQWAIFLPFNIVFYCINIVLHSFIHSFIHSGHFYSAPSSPLLLRGAPDYSADTVSEFHAEAHRQLQVKDLPKVPTWRLERESNPRPSG